MKIITKRINSIAKKFGYRFVKIEKYNLKENFAEATKFEKKILNNAAKFSMTGFDRMFIIIKDIFEVHKMKKMVDTLVSRCRRQATIHHGQL